MFIRRLPILYRLTKILIYCSFLDVLVVLKAIYVAAVQSFENNETPRLHIYKYITLSLLKLKKYKYISIGIVNFHVLLKFTVKCVTYILKHGASSLRRCSDISVVLLECSPEPTQAITLFQDTYRVQII